MFFGERWASRTKRQSDRCCGLANEGFWAVDRKKNHFFSTCGVLRKKVAVKGYTEATCGARCG